MTCRDRACIIYGVFLIGVVCFELSTCRGPARADDRRLWLARCMVAEAGFRAGPDDGAIAGVLMSKAARSGKTLVWMVRHYCRGLYRANASWLRYLRESPVQPRYWPVRWAWSESRDDWLEKLERAQAALDGILYDPCDGVASHWRGPHDKTPAWFESVDCGRTKNIFGRTKGTRK